MRNYYTAISCIIIFLFFGKSADAAQYDVVINEVAWMGTSASTTQDEWIELYNPMQSVVPVSGWGLYEKGGQTKITTLEGVIATGEYYLIERTNDDTVKDIPASVAPIPWGKNQGYGLANSGEYLVLKDAAGTIIDEVRADNGWFAGTTDGYFTMERVDAKKSGNDISNWANNNGSVKNGMNALGGFINGTPKTKNSVAVTSSPTSTEQGGSQSDPPQSGGAISSPPTSTPQTDTSSNTPATGESITYLAPRVGEVLINELLISPKENEKEWIELYNTSDHTLSFNECALEDNTGPTFGRGTGIEKLDFITIDSHRYYQLLEGNHFSFGLNNSGDILILKCKDEVIDRVAYGDFEDGNVKDNAPLPRAEEFLTRVPNGITTLNNSRDFKIERVGTPRDANRISSLPDVPLQTGTTSSDTQINEVNDTPKSQSPSSPSNTTSSSRDEQKKNNFSDNETMTVHGIVTAPPTTFSKTSFFIENFEIYNYKGLFPKLVVGDEISVSGAMSENVSHRVKTKSASDIALIQKGKTPSVFEVIGDELDEELFGKLVKVKGTVIEKTNNYVYVADSDDNEHPFYLKSQAIDRKKIKEGDRVEMTGVVVQMKDELAIAPRFANDMKVVSGAIADESNGSSAIAPENHPAIIDLKGDTATVSSTAKSIGKSPRLVASVIQAIPFKYSVSSFVFFLILTISLAIKYFVIK